MKTDLSKLDGLVLDKFGRWRDAFGGCYSKDKKVFEAYEPDDCDIASDYAVLEGTETIHFGGIFHVKWGRLFSLKVSGKLNVEVFLDVRSTT